MELLPVQTAVIRAGDDIASLLFKSAIVQADDIVVISSKIIATAENAFMDLATLTVSPQAKKYAKVTRRAPAFMEAVLREMTRLHGTLLKLCPGAALTEVRPDGMPEGSILIANAGLDESNAPSGMAIGWPRDPVSSAMQLRRALEKRIGGNIGVIITDSCCHPRRLGVSAVALVTAGLPGLIPQLGKEDLYGKHLRITTEAVADQLATAANFLMGNAAQKIPAVIIRGHGLPLSDDAGWVPGIDPKEDLFPPFSPGSTIAV